MAFVTVYGANLVLDSLVGKTETFPTTLHLGLTHTSPTENSTGSTIDETTAASYARISVADVDWSTASDGDKKNAVEFEFPTADEDWGVFRYFVLCDAATGGNLIWWGTLASAMEITEGMTARFGVETLILDVMGGDDG